MRYQIITEKSRADFTAFAPMHKFKGWVDKGIEGELLFDPATTTVSSCTITARTTDFDTGDGERNSAMQEFFDFPAQPKAGFTLNSPALLEKKAEGRYKGELTGNLEFAGVTREVPVRCFLIQKKDDLAIGLSLKWSFKTFGIKRPRLLFLTVKDEVEINASLRCTPQQEAPKEEDV